MSDRLGGYARKFVGGQVHSIDDAQATMRLMQMQLASLLARAS